MLRSSTQCQGIGQAGLSHSVRQLIEQDQARQAAAREALEVENAMLGAERAAMKQELEQLKALMQAKELDGLELYR